MSDNSMGVCLQHLWTQMACKMPCGGGRLLTPSFFQWFKFKKNPHPGSGLGVVLRRGCHLVAKILLQLHWTQRQGAAWPTFRQRLFQPSSVLLVIYCSVLILISWGKWWQSKCWPQNWEFKIMIFQYYSVNNFTICFPCSHFKVWKIFPPVKSYPQKYKRNSQAMDYNKNGM